MLNTNKSTLNLIKEIILSFTYRIISTAAASIATIRLTVYIVYNKIRIERNNALCGRWRWI